MTSQKVCKIFLESSREILVKFAILCYNHYKSWTTLSQVLCDTCENHIRELRIFHEFLENFLQISNEFFMNFARISGKFLTNFSRLFVIIVVLNLFLRCFLGIVQIFLRYFWYMRGCSRDILKESHTYNRTCSQYFYNLFYNF